MQIEIWILLILTEDRTRRYIRVKNHVFYMPISVVHTAKEPKKRKSRLQKKAFIV